MQMMTNYTNITSDTKSVNSQSKLDKLQDWSRKWQVNILHHKLHILTIFIKKIYMQKNYASNDRVINYKLGCMRLNVQQKNLVQTFCKPNEMKMMKNFYFV